MFFNRKAILCCFLIISLILAGFIPINSRKLTENKIYSNTEFKFSLNYPESWYFVDDSLPEQLYIFLSKEKFNITESNPAALVIVGLKGKKGMQFIEGYKNKFDKKSIECKSFKVNKEITADKYSIEESVYYLLFSYNGQYYVTIYSADKKQNVDELETIIKTIIIKK